MNILIPKTLIEDSHFDLMAHARDYAAGRNVKRKRNRRRDLQLEIDELHDDIEDLQLRLADKLQELEPSGVRFHQCAHPKCKTQIPLGKSFCVHCVTDLMARPEIKAAQETARQINEGFRRAFSAFNLSLK